MANLAISKGCVFQHPAKIIPNLRLQEVCGDTIWMPLAPFPTLSGVEHDFRSVIFSKFFPNRYVITQSCPPPLKVHFLPSKRGFKA